VIEKINSTILPNESIEKIKDPVVLAVWVYLLSHDLDVNSFNLKMLSERFDIDTQEAEDIMGELLHLGFIVRDDKGMMLKYRTG